jgi:hypothetical protein
METTILGTEYLQRATVCGLAEVAKAISDEEVPE